MVLERAEEVAAMLDGPRCFMRVEIFPRDFGERPAARGLSRLPGAPGAPGIDGVDAVAKQLLSLTRALAGLGQRE